MSAGKKNKQPRDRLVLTRGGQRYQVCYRLCLMGPGPETPQIQSLMLIAGAPEKILRKKDVVTSSGHRSALNYEYQLCLPVLNTLITVGHFLFGHHGTNAFIGEEFQEEVMADIPIHNMGKPDTPAHGID